MNIIGPDALAFGVDDVAACKDYLTAFGLKPVGVDETGGFFEALDGTGVLIRSRTDPRLPAPLETATMLRQTVYGVADQATVDAIGDELAKDRQVKRLDDGAVEAKRRPRLRAEVSGDEEARARHAGRDRQCAGLPSPARPQQDRRLGRDAGEAAHPFACRLLRAGHSQRGGLLREAPRLQGHGPLQRRRPVPAAGRHARPSHALFHPDADLHEGLRAFRVPHGWSHRADAGRIPFHAARATSPSGVPGGTSSARIGSGTSTARSAATSNTTPTWTSTTTNGLRAKPRWDRRARRRFCSSTASAGRRAVRLPARRGAGH